jgi:hypothetical protein
MGFQSPNQSCAFKIFQEISSLNSIIFDFRSPEKFVNHKYDQEIKRFKALVAN